MCDSSRQVMDTMDAEDDILEELENLEITIEKHKKKLEEKDRMIAELQEQLKKYR